MRRAHQLSNGLLALCLSLLMAGCNDTGAPTETLPDTTRPDSVARYSGPPPASDDVQTFKQEVWDQLAAANRCGACHGANDQSPAFVHDEDINIAYRETNTVVDLDQPAQSRLVQKVLEGHNCWAESDQVCADIITRYIANWAGQSSGNVKVVELTAPAIRDPGATVRFPANASAFASTIHPLLTDYCAECHISGQQTPYIASPDAQLAYQQSRSRINLQSPEDSRLVERLVEDFHNCWDGDCVQSAADMQLAIEDFIATLPTSEPDPDLVLSKAVNLTADGIVANTGGRYQNHLVALYEFKTGEGSIAYDTSGVSPALDLTLTGNVGWVGGWGIEIGPGYTDEETGNRVRGGKAQGSTTASSKLHQLITGSGEYSIEAWVVPANITQEETPIVTYAGSSEARNVTLAQNMQSYQFFHRSSTTDQNTPLATDNADALLQASRQHLVLNYTPDKGRQIFINGAPVDAMGATSPGLLNEWDNTFALVLGNSPAGDATWEGALRMVAIHNRALTPDQIRANYEVGVGQKFLLLFSVSHLIEVPEAFLVFEVSQFDNYSYLFKEPFFISLDPEAEPSGIPVKGMRIGINGDEPRVGQSYANLDTTLNADQYQPGQGQKISSLGAVIGLERGPELDEFFLTFEQLGSHTNVYLEPEAPQPATPVDLPHAPVMGLKLFPEIHHTMSRLTGVSTTQPQVADTFRNLQQQLPSATDIESFQSAQQMAVTQLAIRYCGTLVDDPALRSALVPEFDFQAPPDTALDSAGRTLLFGSLIDRFIGTALPGQPDPAEVEAELERLVDQLTICGDSCTTDRTETVVKASCAAVLGSATTLLQ